MAKLNQIIAVEKGVKSGTYSKLTDLNKAAQKPELFNGFQKIYAKKDDDGEDLPGESKRVQFTTDEVLRGAERAMTELMDVTARKDWTNCVAKGTAYIDGKAILSDAPVSFLLFLEKQLTDLKTLVGNLPVLDIADDWKKDSSSGLYKTEPTATHRTKKVQKPLVMYPATDKHPAQTQLVTEDVIAGFWNLVKHSGAMPKPEKMELLEKIEKLLKAIKEAREGANMCDEVTVPKAGTAIFGYLLGD